MGMFVANEGTGSWPGNIGQIGRYTYVLRQNNDPMYHCTAQTRYIDMGSIYIHLLLPLANFWETATICFA